MARVQKIESDSSFNQSNVLNGTVLTYKTLRNGRIVHKAKLPNGSVVEISPRLRIVKLSTPQQGFAATYQLQDSAGTVLGANINVIQDIFIQSASFIQHATAQDQQLDPSITIDDPYIKFVFYTQLDSQAASYKTIYVPVKKLVDTYTAGKGLILSNGQFNVNSDSSSDTARYLTIGENYIGLKNIGADISQALQEAKDYTDNIVSHLSNSISLSNYYTKAQIDGLLQTKGDVYCIYINQVEGNKRTFQGVRIPVGIQTSLGNYYPIQKGSLTIYSDSIEIDISPYLAYDNVSSFTAPWRVWFLARGGSNSADLSDYYTKIQIDDMLSNISDSLSYLRQKFSDYYTKVQTYTKDQIQRKLAQLSNSDYYTKEETQEKLRQLKQFYYVVISS